MTCDFRCLPDAAFRVQALNAGGAFWPGDEVLVYVGKCLVQAIFRGDGTVLVDAGGYVQVYPWPR